MFWSPPHATAKASSLISQRSDEFSLDAVFEYRNMDPNVDVSFPESITDFNNLQEFVRDASPAQWLEYAEELRDNAELIWSHEEESLRVGVVTNAERSAVGHPFRVSGASRTYLLLAGFALENVLKGLLVLEDPAGQALHNPRFKTLREVTT